MNVRDYTMHKTDNCKKLEAYKQLGVRQAHQLLIVVGELSEQAGETEHPRAHNGPIKKLIGVAMSGSGWLAGWLLPTCSGLSPLSIKWS